MVSYTPQGYRAYTHGINCDTHVQISLSTVDIPQGIYSANVLQVLQEML